MIPHKRISLRSMACLRKWLKWVDAQPYGVTLPGRPAATPKLSNWSFSCGLGLAEIDGTPTVSQAQVRR